jgi:hypothetical protein
VGAGWGIAGSEAVGRDGAGWDWAGTVVEVGRG